MPKPYSDDLPSLDQVLLPALRQHKPNAVLWSWTTSPLIRPRPSSSFSTLPSSATATCRLARPISALQGTRSGNPTEPAWAPAWAKVKGRLREIAPRTTDALYEALGPALDSLTPQHAQGFFRHPGYTHPNEHAIRSSQSLLISDRHSENSV